YCLLKKYDEALKDLNTGLTAARQAQIGRHKNIIALGKSEEIKLIYLRAKVYEESGKPDLARKDRATGDRLTEEF
ncbi:hypothetical protein ABI057_15430, partial [Enterococcus faecium]|uniref:hypothetical protein n=1 Tax=Enterococcus faecium TaxID=1352 RepID=UPI003F430D4C